MKFKDEQTKNGFLGVLNFLAKEDSQDKAVGKAIIRKMVGATHTNDFERWFDVENMSDDECDELEELTDACVGFVRAANFQISGFAKEIIDEYSLSGPAFSESKIMEIYHSFTGPNAGKEIQWGLK